MSEIIIEKRRAEEHVFKELVKRRRTRSTQEFKLYFSKEVLRELERRTSAIACRLRPKCRHVQVSERDVRTKWEKWAYAGYILHEITALKTYPINITRALENTPWLAEYIVKVNL
jgi:hypothetical protein